MHLLEDCLFSLTRFFKCLGCLSTLFLQNKKQQHQESGIYGVVPIWGEADEDNIILHTCIDNFWGEMGSQIIPNQDHLFFP